VAVAALVVGMVATVGAGFSAPPGPTAKAAQPKVSALALGVALRHLPKVPAAVTDGFSEASLYNRSIALSAVGRSAAPLQAKIDRAEQLIGADAASARTDLQAAGAATVAADAAAATARAAATRYNELRAAVQQSAVRLYMSGGSALPSSVAATSAQQLFWAQVYLNAVVDPQGALRAQAAALEASRTDTRISAKAKVTAAGEAAAANALLRGERAAFADLKAQLATLDIGNAGLILADHQALAAQEAAELTSPAALQFTPAKALPAPLTTTAVALTWAYALLAEPYLWGGTGPAAFDCSGLMQFVWKKAGVSIPRVAAAQDSWTDPVPLSQLLPGDLVFYGTDNIHHVGMYIGDGLMINAPHTGTVVQVSSIWWSDLAGFGRVHAAGTPIASHELPTAAHPAPKVTKATKPVPSESKPPPKGHKHKAVRAPKAGAGPTTTTTSPPATTTTTTSPTATASTSTTVTAPSTTGPPTTDAPTTGPSTTVSPTTVPPTTPSPTSAPSTIVPTDSG
jgi:cell wall-associated NlpC family hydrolase